MKSAEHELEAMIGELERDLGELARARAWKAAERGRVVVGLLPVFAPRELVWAAGALPAFVRGGGDRTDAVRGDAYYQSYICRLPRSTVELCATGALDVLDGVVVPNTCDVLRNLSGILGDLLPGRLVRLWDPPQAAPGEVARRFLRHELGRLWDDVCALGGRGPDPAELRRSLREWAIARRASERLAAARLEAPWAFPADEAYLVRRAGDDLPPLEHAALVARYLELARGLSRRREDRIRVVLVGAFCEQPPLGLLRAIERAGCYLVDDDLVLSERDLEPAALERAAAAEDPLLALSDLSLHDRTASAVRYDAAFDHGARLVGRVRASAADGAVLAAPSFCDPALLEQPRLQAALEAAGMPLLSFKYAENNGQFQVIREQAGTFSDSVKLWGTAP